MARNAVALTRGTATRTDDVGRLRQRVDDLRTELGRDADELATRIREAFDVRRQVARHPVVATALLLGGAFVVARIVTSLLQGPRRTAPTSARSRPVPLRPPPGRSRSRTSIRA